MHELPVIDKVLKIALAHAQKNNVSQVLAIHLRVGNLSDLESEWMQRYFDYLSKGTMAEGARLKIEWMPAVLRCNLCGESYQLPGRFLGDPVCPKCDGKDSRLLSGKEYLITNLEAR